MTPDFSDHKSEFLNKAIAIVEANMSDEKFGVSELAEAVGMSRSNLLRKIQKATNLSVSVFIRQVRLQNAKQLLQNDTLNVSEVAYKVGFNSTSYFIKCYREFYGYPPGEEGNQVLTEEVTQKTTVRNIQPQKNRKGLIASILSLVILVVLTIVFWPDQSKEPKSLEKSIAVLPFKNDSGDSSNVYIINGLMESILGNLQKIEDLRVVSRTSVEKYRHRSQTIAEISEELDVNYFIEGSGQKIGDQVLLTIQLIEAPKDKHLWSQQYNRQATDIFKLQAEVAKDIAHEIKVFVTPQEMKRIEKPPTQNPNAYDLYLQGLELTNKAGVEELKQAIEYFKQAIGHDQNFALAHAHIAISYYYINYFNAKKEFSKVLNTYADKALLLDSELPQSFIAKGLFYMDTEQYELAAEYFEKVFTYNPNSAKANNFLSDIYGTYQPNTQKYLKSALKGLKLEKADEDSTTSSISYLHLSNAFAQNGFINEAEKFAQKSLAYDPDNTFTEYLYAYIKLAQNRDFEAALDMLSTTLAKDTTRLDVIKELAKVSFLMGDYEKAVAYYDKFLWIKNTYSINLFNAEDVNIGFALTQVGRASEANQFYEAYRTYAENDKSIYKNLMLAAYWAIKGDIETGMQHLKAFTNESNYQYWIVLFLGQDPVMSLLSKHPDYKSTLDKIDKKFWEEHQRTRSMLEAADLL